MDGDSISHLPIGIGIRIPIRITGHWTPDTGHRHSAAGDLQCVSRIGSLSTFSGKEAAMNITVVGTGYVGLVTGACFSDWGHHVLCVDNDENKVKMLKQLQMPI